MILATTGHRDPARWPREWASAWLSEYARPGVEEIRLGGAVGWDTEALRQAAAHRAGLMARAASVAGEPQPWRGFRLAVYVPARVVDQPSEAHRAVNECLDPTLGDRLVELRLVESGAGARAWAEALLRRNTAMLVDGHRDGAGALVTGRLATRVFACWDGRESGGTWDTVRKARERGIEVVVAGGGQ